MSPLAMVTGPNSMPAMLCKVPIQKVIGPLIINRNLKDLANIQSEEISIQELLIP
jgi:hypothetical protein